MGKRRFDPDGQTPVLDWYAGAFPTDVWAIDAMNKSCTFQDVYECLYVGGNVYALLGADDSIVRERVFEQLAKMMGCDYNYIYDQWMRHERVTDLVIYDMNGLKF